MTRLAGLDANFLRSETATTPMHTLKVGVFDAAGARRDALLSNLRRLLEARVRELPILRRRVVHVPLDLHHPVWADDPDFDLDRHIGLSTVPAPGDPRSMDHVIARIARGHLSRDRPLWQLWLLDGLAGDRFAVVVKLHHAVADGAAAAWMLDALSDRAPEAPTRVPERPHAPPTPLPSRRRLLFDALGEKAEHARRFTGLVADTARAGLDIARAQLEGGGERFPRPFATPRTVFNCALPRGRAFASTSLPLEDLRAVKETFEVSLNDVVLALAAGAVHQYLTTAGQPPRRSLLASVPVGSGAGDASPRYHGNYVSNLITSLCTDIRDPVRRLRAIHRATAAAKTTHHRLGAGALRAWSEYTPARAFRLAARLYAGLRVADRHAPAVNLIVSNVRGPARPVTIGGAPLRELYSVGPVLQGIGLNLTAWSYAGRVGFAALSHGDLPVELHALTGGLADALDELRGCAERRAA